MPARRLDTEIDRLYQLPPDEFTAARNALAKTAGTDAAAVKQLVKPPLAAWAVNQLYWQRRDDYTALLDAAKELRATHQAVLSGRTGDVRGAGKAHETAVDAALKAALALLTNSGHPATDATRQAIATTLRALPGDEPAGRLTRVLQPGGFEMLAGLSIGSGGRSADTKKQSAAAPVPVPRAGKAQPSVNAPGGSNTAAKTARGTPKPDPKALARAREAAAKAAQEVREAEHTARREEFEAARAAREAEKAARRLQQARDALQAAQEDVESAEAAVKAAEETRNDARARADAAERELDAARKRARTLD
jgi:hypothetical protein